MELVSLALGMRGMGAQTSNVATLVLSAILKVCLLS